MSVLWLACLCSCGRIRFDGVPADASIDAPVPVPIDFGAAMQIVELASTSGDDDPTLTGDLLEIYFISNRPGGAGASDVWTSSRPSVDQPFSPPVVVASLSSPQNEETTRITADGLTMWVASDRSGPAGVFDLWASTRATRGDPWPAPTRVVELNTMADNDVGAIELSPLELYFASDRATARDMYDLYRTSRVSTVSPWAPAERLTTLETGADEVTPFPLDADTLYFASSIGGNRDLYLATRADDTAPFELRPLSSLNTTSSEEDPWLSPDRSLMFFSSDRTGNPELYIAIAR
jgi:Tol biopolymer transport system component